MTCQDEVFSRQLLSALDMLEGDMLLFKVITLDHSNPHQMWWYIHDIGLDMIKLRFYEGTGSVLCWKWWSNGECDAALF